MQRTTIDFDIFKIVIPFTVKENNPISVISDKGLVAVAVVNKLQLWQLDIIAEALKDADRNFYHFTWKVEDFLEYFEENFAIGFLSC